MEMKASEETLVTTIAEHRLFKDLAPRYLALLAEVAMFKEFAADEVIFREGDPANRFYASFFAKLIGRQWHSGGHGVP